MSAYYNEINEYSALWLKELMAANMIAPGEVDNRDIREVSNDDLRGFTQCHFFAGIGLWSLALRNAGWSDDRPVWTGSCPCQPFSVAGYSEGFESEHHLFPVWHRLIRQSRPSIIFGEQVASKAGLIWAEYVQAELETSEYAYAGFDLVAAGVGAPHKRSRQYFVAEDTTHTQRDQQSWPEPYCGEARRMGRSEQPLSWNTSWQDALRQLRALDDGNPAPVAAFDAVRNAIVPPLAEAFISAYMASAESARTIPEDSCTSPSSL